jgi:alkylhydroperoxidase family enzyme
MSLPTHLREAIHAILSSPGATESSLRCDILQYARFGGPQTHPELLEKVLREFVEKIAEQPWATNDDDFARMRAVGYSDDQLFELTLTCALGAGLKRFDAGLRALGETPDAP